jgi:hypothetical protein
MATSSNRSFLSATSESASVLSRIRDIESNVLKDAMSPRDSRKLLLQLNQMKLNILQGADVDKEDDNSANEESLGHQSVDRPLYSNRPGRTAAEGNGSFPPSIYESENVPYHISIDEGDDVSSSISTRDWSLRSPHLPPKRKSLDRMQTLNSVSKSGKVERTPDLRVAEHIGPPCLSTIAWDVLAFFVTFLIADRCIPREGSGAKKAWREKVTTFALFLLVSACFVTIASVLPLVLCPDTDGYYDAQEVSDDGNVILFGRVYDLQNLSQIHIQSSKTLERYFGQDASHFFPRLPPSELPPSCLNRMLPEEAFNETNAYSLQNVTCPYISIEEELRYGNPCHTSIVGQEQINKKIGSYAIGYLVVPQIDLQSSGLPDGTQFIVVDNIIYNVTQYVSQFRYVDGCHDRLQQYDVLTMTHLKFFSRNPFTVVNENLTDGYLSSRINDLIFAKVNTDATLLFHDMFSGEEGTIVKGYVPVYNAVFMLFRRLTLCSFVLDALMSCFPRRG